MEITSGRPSSRLLRGRYLLGEVLGVGGMAAVYRARDQLLERDVAVKAFRSTAVAQEAIDRQEAEIRTLAQLSHHGLVTVLDAGVHLADPAHPVIFIVMELIRGADLQHRMQRERLSPREVAQVGYDIAEALEYLAHRGVVHRDIKPSNIMLVEYGSNDTRLRAKLVDFGIAQNVSPGETAAPGASVAAGGTVTTTGTAAYLSPEQVLGEEVSPPSDVYALGLVLLECFTGYREYPGDAVASALARIGRDPVIPESLSPAWRHLLAAMTAQHAKHRPLLREVILSLRDLVADDLRRHRAASIVPENEAARLEAVRRYDILDNPPDGTFDRITALAARAFGAPISIVSIVDYDRIWFTSHHGLEIDQIDRDPGLCASAILGDTAWVVEDARTDPRTLANPLVASDFGLQFYAGVPLRTRDGYNLGTLCVLDFEPRSPTDDEMATLHDLAALVTNELDLRLDARLALQRGVQPEPSAESRRPMR